MKVLIDGVEYVPVSAAPPVVVVSPPVASPVIASNLLYYDLGWENKRITTAGFGCANVLVVHFRTGAAVNPQAIGKIAAVEYGGGNRTRHAVLSLDAGDFTKVSTGIWDAKPYADNGNPTIFFNVGGSTGRGSVGLSPDTDYYFNVKNDPHDCLPGDACDMFVELSKPTGL